MTTSPEFDRHKQIRPARKPGLLGIAVIVAALSLIAALVIPMFRGMAIQARARAVHDDFKVFTAAFQAYAAEHGDWPAGDGVPGAIPPGMLKYLRDTNWQRPSPIGGNYAWDPHSLHHGSRLRAAIVIAGSRASPVTRNRIQLEEIDRIVDDAHLDTGSFFLGYRNWPVIVLER